MLDQIMQQGKKQIGFIGIGVLGYTAVQRLLTVYDTIYIYNRTASKMKGLKEEGAVICHSVEELIDQSDCILLMLSDIEAIEGLLNKAVSQGLKDKDYSSVFNVINNIK